MGSNSITLSTSQLPAHNHSFNLSTNSTGGHTHDRGDMNIYGYLEGLAFDQEKGSKVDNLVFTRGEHTNYFSKKSSGDTFLYIYKTTFNANGNWTGNTSENGSHSHTISGTINNAGSGASINIIQSSKVVVK